nr:MULTISPECIES: hypothetical protein [Bacillus]
MNEKEPLINERTGHDRLHISRIATLSVCIAKEEGAPRRPRWFMI